MSYSPTTFLHHLPTFEADAASYALCYLISDETKLSSVFKRADASYIKEQLKDKIYNFSIGDYRQMRHIIYITDPNSPNNDKDKPKTGMAVNEFTAEDALEKIRQQGAQLNQLINKNKLDSITLIDYTKMPNAMLALAEGVALTNYQFLKYKKKADKLKHSLTDIYIYSNKLTQNAIEELQNVVDSVNIARTLINEPLSYLTAEQLADDAKKILKNVGVKVSVWNKQKIEQEKMGGLLAVNFGSIDPPTFSIYEWKPTTATNTKPIILVGKGVVYDTGGLSLKNTKGMDIMKCDMSGAAAVIGTMHAIAKNNLPLHVIGLVPATDNRPDGNAYVPGDVVTMHDGSTVEVLNTDAEGRMLLADALSYARKYEPELVIDLATLTGSAFRALGTKVIPIFSNASKATIKRIEVAGRHTFERVAPQPMYEDYETQLKSDIADLKNIGGANAGMITAAKFLQHFTHNDYPWIHIDLTMAWNYSTEGYRLKNGAGAGIRLLYNFLKSK